MAQLSTFSSLYPLMVPWLPGCSTDMMLWGLRNAVRRFFKDTEAFHEVLPPVPVVDYQQDYTITSQYSAGIQRVLRIVINQMEQDYRLYDIIDGNIIRWDSNHIFHDLDDRMLACDTCVADEYTDWTGIDDGSVIYTITGSTYEAEDLDFTDCTTMNQVALVLQTGLRAALESNQGFVRWDAENARLLVWVVDGDLSYLTAGTSGTDISGAGYMNGLTGAGTLSGWMEVEVVFRPELTATDLPTWIFDRYAEALVAGAVIELAGMKGENFPWSNPGTVAQFLPIYREHEGDAKLENIREGKEEGGGLCG